MPSYNETFPEATITALQYYAIPSLIVQITNKVIIHKVFNSMLFEHSSHTDTKQNICYHKIKVTKS